MRVRVTGEKVNVAMTAADLSNQIKNSQCNECSTSDERECITYSTVNRHAAPHDQSAEHCCEQHMTDAGKSSYGESFRGAPLLRARCDYEWKPMSRKHGVQKTDGKSCSCQGEKDDAIHIRRHLIHLVVMRQNGKRSRGTLSARATEFERMLPTHENCRR
jgi:hypothetical protein